MGVLKEIIDGYKTLKRAKEECCQNLINNLDEHTQKMKIEHEELAKEVFQEYKKNAQKFKKVYNMRLILNDKLSKEEMELKLDIYDKKIKKAINDVDDGKITYIDFLSLIE